MTSIENFTLDDLNENDESADSNDSTNTSPELF